MMNLFTKAYKKQEGVTLSETLVYLAIFGMVFLGIFQFMFYVSENNQRADERNELQKSMILVDEHMIDSFERTVSIDEANSTFQNDSGVLRLTVNGSFVEYRIQNGRLVFIDGAATTAISSDMFNFTKFNVDRILDNQDELKGVKVQFTIASPQISGTTRSFESSYLIR